MGIAKAVFVKVVTRTRSLRCLGPLLAKHEEYSLDSVTLMFLIHIRGRDVSCAQNCLDVAPKLSICAEQLSNHNVAYIIQNCVTACRSVNGLCLHNMQKQPFPAESRYRQYQPFATMMVHARRSHSVTKPA